MQIKITTGHHCILTALVVREMLHPLRVSGRKTQGAATVEKSAATQKVKHRIAVCSATALLGLHPKGLTQGLKQYLHTMFAAGLFTTAKGGSKPVSTDDA